MKIRTLALGEYGSPPTRFCLYLFPTPLTPPLLSPSRQISNDKQHQLPAMMMTQGNKDMDCCFLCLDDLEALFFNDNHDDAKHALSKAYYEHPSWFCADQTTGKPFITTRAVAHIANQLSMDTLVDLCTMTESDICHGNADHLLRRVVDLRPISITAVDQELVPTRLLDGAARFRVHGNTTTTACSPMIRLSPPSEQQHPDTPSNTSTRFDPCRDDVAASSGRRLSFMPHKDASKVTTTSHERQQQHLPLPKPSSLLLKRSAHHHHNKAPSNLTILTPAYGAGDPASIHSAPLHPRGHKQNPVNPLQSAKQQRLNKVIKRAPPATAAPWSKHKTTTSNTLAAAATARPQTEFPSPPIVPSQQRYAPPTTSGLKTATLVPKTPAVPAAPMASQPLSRKQQFLQPLEMLYDNIEQTKSLKATLDDQIRHSSTLIHTLQSSSTMVENLTRKYVRESVHQQLQDYVNRIERLEQRMTATRRHYSPPTTPPSQQQGDLKHLLSDLVNRLDRLESKMDTRQ